MARRDRLQAAAAGVAGWTQEQRNDEARRLYALAGYSASTRCASSSFTTPKHHRACRVRWRPCGATCSAWRRDREPGVAGLLQTRRTRSTRSSFASARIGDYDDPYALPKSADNHGMNDMAYKQPRYDELVTLATREADRQHAWRSWRRPKDHARRHAHSPHLLLRDEARGQPWVVGLRDNILTTTTAASCAS